MTAQVGLCTRAYSIYQKSISYIRVRWSIQPPNLHSPPRVSLLSSLHPLSAPPTMHFCSRSHVASLFPLFSLCYFVLHVCACLYLFRFNPAIWCRIWLLLLRNTKPGWRHFHTYLRFRTDVGCWGKTGIRTGFSWRTYSATKATLFGTIRISACFGVRWSVIPAVEICRGPRIPLSPTNFVGDVTRVLLEKGVIRVRPLGLGPSSSRLISPIKKLCC